MAEVLTAPVRLDGYYQSTPPRCRSPRPPYGATTNAHDRNDLDDSVPRVPYHASTEFSPELSSVASSPELSSILNSTDSSTTSSVASSICLDDTKPPDFDLDDPILPSYSYEIARGLEALSSEDTTPSAEEAVESPSEPEPHDVTPVPEIFVTRTSSLPADDSFVRHEPSRHVDYLSHDWREEDIWASWRYMVEKRKELTNGVRLENASWRTWAKKKYNLRTVSAEKLNWLKDCDVTWLYGPLSTGSEILSSNSPQSPPVSPAEQKQQPLSKKPILKKRSVSELMLRRSLSSSSLLKQATAAIESQNLGVSRTNRPPLGGRSTSDYVSSSRSKLSVNGSYRSTECQSPSPTKRIHFNDQVQQCIAVDKFEQEDPASEDDNQSSSDEDDYGLVMLSRTRSRGRSRSRSSERKSSGDPPQTIAMLPSTKLKYFEDIPAKASSFLPFNSFWSSPKPAATQRDPEIRKPSPPSSSYSFLDDDDDLADLGWVPKNTFGSSNKRSGASSPAVQQDETSEDDLILPNYSYEDEEEQAATSIIGRAVDAVNTARDIAHVLWNVGWSR